MTLDQYAALAQGVAAIAVVASLVYVAIQLRQNTAMMRASASRERVQRDAELNSKISDSPEFAALRLNGRAAFDRLEEKDRIRLIFFQSVCDCALAQHVQFACAELTVGCRLE
jgi:hypothetical protein